MPVINTNTKALDAQESMRVSGLAMSQAMERLSTGKKINSAKDDAAGLAITNRMTSQIRGIAKAINNTNDAISMSQTAEGALGNVGDILQRMRELAVQSASGTMNDSDRASLNLEVSQLKQQVDQIANTTNHNNIKLLDGSSKNITIQVGVNSGDTIKMGFDSVKTKDIGIGSKATLSSVGGTYAASNFEALTSGALFLNGVAVGASAAVDDNASYSSSNVGAEASAIAKAAAINKVSALSGVYAKAGATTVSGAAMGTVVSTSGTITINGVTTDSIFVSTDKSITRQNVVIGINAKSAITGVAAIDTGSDDLGVTLVAKDGRNVTVAYTTLTSTTTGVAAAGTSVGSYDLYTLDGRDINVSFRQGTVAAEESSGLRAGTYKADNATYTSYLRSYGVLGVAPNSADTGLLNGNSMIINGVAIGQALSTDDTASDTTATSSTRAASAIAIAAAINRSSAQTGVTASATPNVLRGQGYTAAGSAATLYLNGQTITVNSTTRNGVIDTINNYANLTGVTASAWGDGIEYKAADGRNISIAATAGAASFGLTNITIGTSSSTSGAALTYMAQVTLSSSNKFTVQSGSNGVTNLEKLGFRQGTFGGSDNGLKVNQLDISSANGASQALVAIDAAINTISAAQAVSGAYNNRLDSIVNNLSETNQNITASRSRILDTDYATETTSLAKQQIISQAATAMLAQANQSSQSILSLLK